MKKVLITGANSYVGTTFEKWIRENNCGIITDTLDMHGDGWKNFDFSSYDAVFHVAGIAHVDVGRATEEQKALYYKINTDLTAECAKKAKTEGVKQFVFMSSMIVYGESAGIGQSKVITHDTPLSPANFYGDSKVKAEVALQILADEKFRVVILRPPMIYGNGSKGNYPILAGMARRLPLFPDVENQRSMLYVENLCKFVSLMLINEEQGIFFPQNTEYVCTSSLVKQIASAHGKKMYLIKMFNPALICLGKGKLSGLVNKAFGNMVYEKSMSEYKEEYRMFDLEKSVRETENERSLL